MSPSSRVEGVGLNVEGLIALIVRTGVLKDSETTTRNPTVLLILPTPV